MPEIPMIHLENVTKKLGTFTLSGISADFPMGYIIGLIGPNGSGKTTLINLLLGLLHQNEGTVSIGGMCYPQDEKQLHDISGCVLGGKLFDEEVTLIQNADYYGKYYSRYRREDFLALCLEFGLESERKYKKLSRGEELKFQFAFALSHHPQLLFLDEPTGNFDPQFRREFLLRLKEFIADGEHTVLLATHLTDDLDRLADYILYLEKGKVLLSMDIEEIHESYRLVTGEGYKIRLLPKEAVIYTEETSMCSRALVRHRRWMSYDKSLTVVPPTIEQLMYFMTKRG